MVSNLSERSKKMTDTKRTYRKGRLIVELDKDKVVPGDPGADTPAMVFDKDRQHSATYWYACAEAELTTWKDGGVVRLTDAELGWLDGLDREITDFLYC
jgi:hypothetical protein